MHLKVTLQGERIRCVNHLPVALEDGTAVLLRGVRLERVEMPPPSGTWASSLLSAAARGGALALCGLSRGGVRLASDILCTRPTMRVIFSAVP
jgi:hypothetical protein